MDVLQICYTNQWQNLHALDIKQQCDYYSFYENDSISFQQDVKTEHLYQHTVMHLCSSIRTGKKEIKILIPYCNKTQYSLF